MERLQRMPLPVIPTILALLTLSNVYGGMGYTGVRHISMIAGTIVLLLYIVKIIKYPKTFLNEYKQTVPCSLTAAIFMVAMILGSYYYAYNQTLGLIIWGAAVIMDAIHIVIFFTRNALLNRNIITTVPSWFVTANGIMVSCVVGSGFGFNHILKYIVYYGIVIYLVLIPIMIVRLLTKPIPDAVYHTMPIVLAPCSLCFVSYLNVIENPKQGMVFFLYFCVLASLLFIIVKLPKFFRYSFVPGFAGLTFPMAIGIVATNKMAGYMTNVVGNESLANLCTQLAGIQILLTSMLVMYVLLNFIIMAMKLERK